MEKEKGNKGLIPPGLNLLADNIAKKDNILGANKADGARWAKDLNLPKESDTIFFAGCGYQYSGDLESLMSLIRKIDKSAVSTEMAMSMAAFQKKIGIDAAGIFRKVAGKGGETDAQPLRDAVFVLANLGIKVGYLGQDEPCCGGILHYIGLQNDFAEHARGVADRLKSKSVKQIISIVPSCTNTLRKLVPQATGSDSLQVRHFCEVVADNIASKKLHYPKKMKAVYHDPCQLVRYMGIVEQPRKILRAIEGIELLETQWTSGEMATCCGGGGGFEAVFPELSEILAVNRAKELADTGAGVIVTHCPGCIMQLKNGLKQLGANDIEVLDLAQIVATAMRT